LAHRLAILDILILGDSKVIIEWLNNAGSLQVCSIKCWKEQVIELKKLFTAVTFEHVYREDKIIRRPIFFPKRLLEIHLEPLYTSMDMRGQPTT
jgi:hypothetical protein